MSMERKSTSCVCGSNRYRNIENEIPLHQRNANEPEAIVLYRVEIIFFSKAGETGLKFQSEAMPLNACVLYVCSLL
jgi:hypothetical protein